MKSWHSSVQSFGFLVSPFLQYVESISISRMKQQLIPYFPYRSCTTPSHICSYFVSILPAISNDRLIPTC